MSNIFLKKGLSIFIVSILILQTLIGCVPNMSYGEKDTTAIDMDIKVIGRKAPDEVTADGVPVYKYLSGESIVLRGQFKVSGTDVNLPYGSVKIWAPKSHDKIKKVDFVDSINATSTVKSGNKDPKEFSVTYNFKKITGGTKGAYPVSFKFENIITPNGTRQPFYIGIFDKNGNIVFKMKKEVIFEAVASTDYIGDKEIYDKEHHDEFLGYYSLDSKPTNTPDNLKNTRVVFSNRIIPIPPKNKKGDVGEYRATGFKVVDRIPDEAVFLKDDKVNKGWVVDPNDDRVYTKIVMKKDYPNLNTYSRLNFPIALAFPNQPYNNNRTKNFVNKSDFYYYNEKEFVNVKMQDPASVAFYVKQEKPGDFSLDKSSDLENNHYITDNRDNVVVDVAKERENVKIFYKPDVSSNKGILIWPREETKRGAFYYTNVIEQWARPTNNNTTYIYQNVNVNEGSEHGSTVFDPKNDDHKTNPRMYYDEITVDLKEFFGLEKNGNSNDSTVKWAKENITFDVYKTFTTKHALYYSDPQGNQYKVTNTDKKGKIHPESVLVKSGVKFGETVKIDDKGGYYTGTAIVFSNPALNNTSRDGKKINALPLRNAKMIVRTKLLPVKAGAVSIKKDGSKFVAPKEYDLIRRFCDEVIKKIEAGKLKEAKELRLVYNDYMFTELTNGDYSNPPENIVTGKSFYNESNSRNWSNNQIIFRPNFQKLGLRVSGDKTYLYEADPTKREYNGSFEGYISPDGSVRVEGASKVKNLKGIVLLPAGVNYVRTTNLAGAKGEPEIIDNYKNTGRQAIVYSFGDMTDMSTGSVNYTVRLTKEAKDAADISANESPANTIDTWLSWDNTSNVIANEGAQKDVMDLNNDGSTLELDHKKTNLYLFMPKETITTKYVSLDNKSWSLQAPFQDIDGDIYYKLKLVNQYVDPIEKLVIIDAFPYKGDYKTVQNEEGEWIKRGPKQTSSEFKTPLVEAVSKVKGNEIVDGANQKFDYYYSTSPIEQKNPNLVPEDSWIAEKDFTEWNKATAFKAVMKDGEIIPAAPEKGDPNPAKNEVSIYLHSKIPHDKKLLNLSKSYNSVAYKEGAAVINPKGEFLEGNEVVSSNIRYTVSGTAFRDYKRDGFITEDRLNGVKAQLVYAEDTKDMYGSHKAGDLVPTEIVDSAKLDDKGNIVVKESDKNETYTDKDGKYYFIVYKRGKYKVKFTRVTDKEQFVQYGKNTGKNRSNTNNTGWNNEFTSNDVVYSTNFELDPYSLKYDKNDKLDLFASNLHQIRNVAIDDSKLDINIYKVGINGKQRLEDGTPLNSAKFEIFKKLENGNKGESLGVKSTDKKGKLTFEDVAFGSYILAEKASPTGYYTLNEIEFKIDKDGVTFEGADKDKYIYDRNTNTTTVQNNPILGMITINKKANGNNQYGENIEGTVFTLWRDGKQVMDYKDPLNPVPLEATTNNNGIATFEKIAGGSYVVKEKSVSEGYTSIDTKNTEDKTDDIDLKVDGAQVLVPSKQTATKYQDNNVNLSLGNKEVLASISVTKRDADTLDLLSGVEFSIYKKEGNQTEPSSNSKALETKKTKNGKVVFEDLKYGTYFIKETKSSEGYKNNSDVYTVNVTDDGRPYYVSSSVSEPYVKNEKIKGNIEFNKVDFDDSNVKLAGIKFKLLNEDGTSVKRVKLDENNDPIINNGIKELEDIVAISDADGKVSFERVPYGKKYKIKELEAKEGYVLPENGIVKSNVDVLEEGKTYSLGNIKNEKIKGKLSIKKVDFDNTNISLKAVKFALFKTDANNNPIGEAVYTATTNDKGVATFKKITLGKYVLKETQTLEGYVLPENYPNKIVEFTMDNNILDYTDADNVLKNKKMRGSVGVTKVDAEDESKKLSGVKFGLFQNDKKVYEAVTNAEGKALFTGVIYGEYKLKEIETLANYNLSTEEKDVNIDADAKVIDLGNITNQIKKGSVIFTKVDKEDENKKLSGVTFELQQNGKTKYTATSSKDGKVKFENVIYGIYDLVETKSLDNYNKLDKQERVVNIDAEGKIVDLGNITNQIKKGSVSLVKVDAEDESKKLSGVKFGLFKDGKKIYEAVTDAEGKALFTGVIYGEYKLKEIETIKGYKLSKQEILVKVIKDGEKIDLGKFKNEKEKVEKPKHMPSTGDSSNNILQYGFMVILMGLMMLVSGKKRV